MGQPSLFFTNDPMTVLGYSINNSVLNTGVTVASIGLMLISLWLGTFDHPLNFEVK